MIMMIITIIGSLIALIVFFVAFLMLARGKGDKHRKRDTQPDENIDTHV